MAVRLSAQRTSRTLFLRKNILFNISGTHFCQRLSKPQALVRPEGLGKFKILPHRGFLKHEQVVYMIMKHIY
jgi:hypothetical protein